MCVLVSVLFDPKSMNRESINLQPQMLIIAYYAVPVFTHVQTKLSPIVLVKNETADNHFMKNELVVRTRYINPMLQNA